MTNHAYSEEIPIDQEKVEKMTDFKYLGQGTHLKDTRKDEIYAWISAAWSCFRKPPKTRKYSKIDNSPFTQKTSNGPMCLANNDLWLPNIVS